MWHKMTSSASNDSLHSKVSWRRGKSSGWAAFDLKQQQKQGHELEAGNGPYPPISSSVSSLLPSQNFVKNNNVTGKSFSSVLQHPINSSTLSASRDFENPTLVGASNANPIRKLIEENYDESSVTQACKKLEDLHFWADKSVIEDVMAGANNNFYRASILLGAMISSDNFWESNKASTSEVKFKSEDFYLNNSLVHPNADDSLENNMETTTLSSFIQSCFNLENKEMVNDNKCYGQMPQKGSIKRLLNHSICIPIEREWEEDDVYLIHRKEAMRTMRSATRHSRMATDAYLRGDHFCAQEYSLKAQEEWMAAEGLNAKAAMEILSIRNCNNDVWTLDLHGLHAAEAVQALQEHLRKIELRIPVNRSVSPTRENGKASILRSASLESIGSMNMEKLNEQRDPFRQRQTSLQVITGKGNHSRGEAALPTAIRSFLNENRYRYDETRSGVITVWPKFRRP